MCAAPRAGPGQCAVLLGVAPGVNLLLVVALRVRRVLPVAPRVNLKLGVALRVCPVPRFAPGECAEPLGVALGVRPVLPVTPGVSLMLLLAPGVCSVGLHRASVPAAGVTGVRLAGTEPSAGTSVRKTAR